MLGDESQIGAPSTPRPRGDGCLWKAALALVVAIGVLAGIQAVLDRAARELSSDVCERSSEDLVRAAGAGDVDAVRHELTSGSPDRLDHQRNSALGCAIPRGRTQVVDALLDAGADPNEPTGADSFQELPIELAYKRNDLHTVEALLNHAADPNRSTPTKTKLLTQAIRDHNDLAVALLLDHGADPDRQGPDVPLVVALKAADWSAVGSLLDHGAHADGRPGQRPVVEAAAANRTAEFQALVAAGADLHLPENDGPGLTVGESSLVQAAGAGNDTIVAALLAAGTDPDATAYLSPLLRSIAYRHPSVARLLLDAGADPNRGQSDSFTLALTLQGLDPALSTLLLPPGTTLPGSAIGTLPIAGHGTVPGDLPFEALDVPPLAAAIAAHDDDTVRLLLAHGADPNRLAADRWSPLYLAAATCSTTETQMLLDAGARADLSPAAYQPAAVSCPTVRALLEP